MASISASSLIDSMAGPSAETVARARRRRRRPAPLHLVTARQRVEVVLQRAAPHRAPARREHHQATFDQPGGCSRSCSSEAPGLGGGVVFAHSLGEGLGHVTEVALLLGREGLA